MATHEIFILGVNTIPDASGDVFQQPYSILDTGPPAIDPLVLVFNDSGAKDGVRGAFQVPQNYVGTAKLNVYWNSSNTTAARDAVFDLSYLARSAGEDMGAAATDTTDTVTSLDSTTAFALNKATMTLTAGDFTAGDIVTFELFRDGVEAADDLALALMVFVVTFEYADA